MTDLPPVQYLDEAARVFGYASWQGISSTHPYRLEIIAHARALHESAELKELVLRMAEDEKALRAEIAALRPRETLEHVAWREAREAYDSQEFRNIFEEGFLRAAEMAKAGELPDA